MVFHFWLGLMGCDVVAWGGVGINSDATTRVAIGGNEWTPKSKTAAPAIGENKAPWSDITGCVAGRPTSSKEADGRLAAGVVLEKL